MAEAHPPIHEGLFLIRPKGWNGEGPAYEVTDDDAEFCEWLTDEMGTCTVELAQWGPCPWYVNDSSAELFIQWEGLEEDGVEVTYEHWFEWLEHIQKIVLQEGRYKLDGSMTYRNNTGDNMPEEGTVFINGEYIGLVSSEEVREFAKALFDRAAESDGCEGEGRCQGGNRGGGDAREPKRFKINALGTPGFVAQ